jgi:amicoumacin kinase
MQKKFQNHLLKAVVSNYNANNEPLLKLSGGYQNQVFEFNDRVNERILRVTSVNRHHIESLRSEFAFIDVLANNGVSVSKPIQSLTGSFVIETSFQNDKYYLTAFSKAAGHLIDVCNPQDWNEDIFRKWGSTMGKMHSISKENFHQFKEYKRPSWSGLDVNTFSFLSTISEQMVTSYENLLGKIMSLPRENHTYGLIHNDFHQGNFFVDEGKLTIFDFDDCSFNWFAQDIAATYYHAIWQGMSFNPDNKNLPIEFIRSFMDGYSREIELYSEILEQVPLFLKLREVFLFTLFHKKWDLQNLEDWQQYTLKDLQSRIEREIPYTDIDFKFF